MQHSLKQFDRLWLETVKSIWVKCKKGFAEVFTLLPQVDVALRFEILELTLDEFRHVFTIPLL